MVHHGLDTKANTEWQTTIHTHIYNQKSHEYKI